MTRIIGQFTDRVLSLVAPSGTASAAYQTKCVRCGASTRSQLCGRDCIAGKCEPWRCGSCGTC